MQLIAGSVAFQFLQPPVAPVLGRGAILATAMTMPETAVDENCDAMLWHNNVGGDEASCQLRVES